MNPFKAILSLTFGLLLLFFIFKTKLFLYFASVIIFLSLLSDSLAYKISFVLHKLQIFIGNLLLDFFLILVYICVFTPVGLIYKILNLKAGEKKTNSYFNERRKTFKFEDLKHQW